MMPLVLNKHCCGNPPDAVFIGRPSVWGNRFVIGRDGTRAEVIAKYEAWLRQQIDLLGRLDELRGKHLVCFCAPAACHGDLLLRLANASRGERIAWWRGARVSDEHPQGENASAVEGEACQRGARRADAMTTHPSLTDQTPTGDERVRDVA